MDKLDPQKGTNWTIVVIAGICIIGFIGWNYIQTIQDQNDIEREKISQEKQIQDDATAKEELDKQERASNLSFCLSTALLNYSQNWDAACETQYKDTERDYAYCVSTGVFGSTNQTFCRQKYPEVLASNCTLSSVTASRIDLIKKNEEDRCYQQYSE